MRLAKKCHMANTHQGGSRTGGEQKTNTKQAIKSLIWNSATTIRSVWMHKILSIRRRGNKRKRKSRKKKGFGNPRTKKGLGLCETRNDIVGGAWKIFLYRIRYYFWYYFSDASMVEILLWLLFICRLPACVYGGWILNWMGLYRRAVQGNWDS